MEREIPIDVIDMLLNLGREDKEDIKQNDEVINALKSLAEYSSKYGLEDWQMAAEGLPRESQIILFKGLVYADILAWGPNAATPVNHVFSKLSKSCWPDTVYQLIWWANNVCDYHQYDTNDYSFKKNAEKSLT